MQFIVGFSLYMGCFETNKSTENHFPFNYKT